jgi:hypothetical protein
MSKKKAATKSKPIKPVEPVKILSDKEKVIAAYKSAVCKPLKGGFIICRSKPKRPNDYSNQIGAGISSSTEDAWKKAANLV